MRYLRTRIFFTIRFAKPPYLPLEKNFHVKIQFQHFNYIKPRNLLSYLVRYIVAIKISSSKNFFSSFAINFLPFTLYSVVQSTKFYVSTRTQLTVKTYIYTLDIKPA